MKYLRYEIVSIQDAEVINNLKLITLERRNTHFLLTTGRSNFYTHLAIHSTL